MKQKELFNKALSDALNNYPFSDEETVMKHIRERAKNMKTEENFRQANFREITVEHYEPKKSTRIIHAFAGIAGTAAVLTGAVFGLNWLNEHGGLKGPDVQGAGAGYHEDNSTAYVADNTQESKDILNAVGDVLKFDGLTATIEQVDFDGRFLRVIYSVADYEERYGNAADAHMSIVIPDRDERNKYLLQSGGTTYDAFSYEDEKGHRNVYMIEVSLDEGETAELAFEFDKHSSPDSVPERVGGYTLTGIDRTENSFTVRDINEIEWIQLYPLGVSIASPIAYTEGQSLSLELKYRDGSCIHLFDRKSEKDPTIPANGAVCSGTGALLSKKYEMSDGNWLTSITSLLPDKINVHDIAAVIINGSEIPLNVYTGMELDNAKELLEKNNINYQITEYASGDIPAGSIIRTEPEFGLLDEKPDNVTLYVSTGTESAAGIDIDDTIEFSDCTVNVSGIERYGNTIKLTLDAYAKENCDLSTYLFNICEIGDREENTVPKGIFFERDENDHGHLRFTFVFQPYLPNGTERTYMLKKFNYQISDSDEAAYFTLKGADTLKSYIRELDTVGTGLAGTEIPVRRIEIDPYSISFDVIGSPSFEENFSIKFKDGRIYEYNKEALVRNGRIWTDLNGDMVCAVNPDHARIAENGDYYSEKISDHLRYFLFSEEPIFDVNEIESINILGAEIPITAE